MDDGGWVVVMTVFIFKNIAGTQILAAFETGSVSGKKHWIFGSFGIQTSDQARFKAWWCSDGGQTFEGTGLLHLGGVCRTVCLLR